ncbi:MAG: ASKHA domain-containing protein [Chloroflexi bacterium]|nr:ASKHA domain-containing protein [Chloroflexota bacterium]
MMGPEKKATYQITLEPIGTKISVDQDTSILDAARRAGVEIVAVCAGNGTCGTCKCHPISGKFSKVNSAEQTKLLSGEIDSGVRLACQTRVLSDSTVQFPPESLSTLQRVQLEGTQNEIPVHPAVRRLEVTLPQSSYSSKSRIQQIQDLLKTKHHIHITIPEKLSPLLFAMISPDPGRVSVIVRENELITFLPPESQMYGFAVDVGTTKIAGYLVDLQTGHTLSSGGITNPQIAYGEDVISRIRYIDEQPDGKTILQKIVVEGLNTLLEDLCRKESISINQVVDCVIVGNTAMHHILAGFPVHSLGTAPYNALVVNSMCFPAKEIGLSVLEGVQIYLPPNIAGFVGGDHVAMLLATDFPNQTRTALALDIGTNTEISLIHEGQHFSCSCASGPAFEGAHIRNGLRAVPGAIERVLIEAGTIQLQTIQNKPAIGICGSGILDAVAEMRKENLIDERGTFVRADPRLVLRDGRPEFVLAREKINGAEKEIGLNRKDVNEVQLAKAAIRSGIEVLMKKARISPSEIDLFLVAGAFGTYLDPKNAVRIGMFPKLPPEKFHQVGNAAGSGAREMLVSTLKRAEAEKIAGRIEYVELTTAEGYADIFMEAIRLS